MNLIGTIVDHLAFSLLLIGAVGMWNPQMAFFLVALVGGSYLLLGVL